MTPVNARCVVTDMRRELKETLESRFWRHVDFDPHDTERCWPWKGATQRGYAAFRFYDIDGKPHRARAHRQAYILENGEVTLYGDADGFEVDHRCHDPRVCTLGDECPHRRCYNPHHLQLVTRAENTAPERMAKVAYSNYCPQGHEYTAANTSYRRSDGGRYCKTCNRENSRKYYREILASPRVPKTHCPQGHPYDADNTKYNKHGHYSCRECARESTRQSRRSKRSTKDELS